MPLYVRREASKVNLVGILPCRFLRARFLLLGLVCVLERTSLFSVREVVEEDLVGGVDRDFAARRELEVYPRRTCFPGFLPPVLCPQKVVVMSCSKMDLDLNATD